MRRAITDQIVAEGLAVYPLDAPSVVAPLEASVRNDSFLVEDAAGARYVLRRYRRNPDARRIDFQLRFQQRLRVLGYPTSEIIASASGGLVVPSAAGPWVLFSHVDGSEYDFANMGQVREAGRRLAEFHTITSAIELEEVVIDINPQLRRWWTHGEEELAALAALFRAGGVEQELTFLRGWHADLIRRWPLARLDALPVGWVHSDFHGRNMVFVGDKLRGLFDFDILHRGFWIEDIAHALFMFGREFLGSTRIRPEAARFFLDAYDGVRPQAEEEREAISMMAVLVWVHSAPYHALLARDGEDTLAWFRHYVARMQDLRSEMERLGNAGIV